VIISDLLTIIVYMFASDIGLRKFANKSLSLLPYTVILLLSVVQLKNFQFLRKQQIAKRNDEAPNTRRISSSIMIEIDTNNSYTQDEAPIFSAWIDTILIHCSYFFKRLCILHQPKLLLISLFIAAQINRSVIGLLYFLVVILLAPVPFVAAKIWFLISLYSSFIIMCQYLFQFPYFGTKGLNCTPLDPTKVDQNNPCHWLQWFGLDFQSAMVGSVLWPHLMVLIMALLQTLCNRWRDAMVRRRLYQPGLLFLEDDEDEQVIPREDQSFPRRVWTFLWSNIKFLCNHFFEKFGYEISILALLIGSLIMIKNIWGLLWLVLFGLTLFIPKQKIGRWWTLFVIIMALNMLVLYVSTMLQKLPVPVVERYLIFLTDEWQGKITFKYVVLWTHDIDNIPIKASPIIIIMYVILFFMALQARVFFEKKSVDTKPSTLHVDDGKEKDEEENLDAMDPPTLLTYFQKKQGGKMHVSLPHPKNADGTPVRDFTVRSDPRNLYDELKLLLVFRGFPKLVMVVVFVDATIKASLIGIVQMVLCLVFLNLGNHVYWRTRKFWIWLGIFYYAYCVIEALFQIPLTVVDTNPEKWMPGKTWPKLLTGFVGLTEFSPTNIVFSVIIITLFYIQDKIFISKDYALFINYLMRQRNRRKKRRDRNKAFRAAQIFKRFAEQAYLTKRRILNMEALKRYKVVQSSNKLEDKTLLKDLYSNIHNSYKKEYSEVESEKLMLKYALRKVIKSPEIQQALIDRVDKFLMEELLNEAQEHVNKKLGITSSDILKTPVSPLETTPLLAQEETQPPPPLTTTVRFAESTTVFVQEFDSPLKTEQDAEEQPKQKPSGFRVFLNSLELRVIRYIVIAIDFINAILRPLLTVALEKREDIIDILTDLDVRDEKQRLFATEEESPVTEPVSVETAHKQEEHMKKPKVYEMNNQQAREILRVKILKLLSTLRNFFNSNTDVVCYLTMVINLIVNPNLLNSLFTICAFGFACMQYPYPTKRYWEVTLFSCMGSIAFQYMIFIIQNVVINSNDQYEYTSLAMIGWVRAEFLFNVIVMYLLIMLAIFHHRDVLKRRGDWVNWDESERELRRTERKRLREQQATNELKGDEDSDDVDSMADDEEVKIEAKERRKSITLLRRASLRRRTVKIENIQEMLKEEEGRTRRDSLKRKSVRLQQPLQLPEQEQKLESVRSSKKKPKKEPSVFVAALYKAYKRSRDAIVSYFTNLVSEETKLGRDLFVIHVCADITGFLFFFFSFSYMSGRPNENAINNIQSNELSGNFVIILFLFFFEICVERVIYLKSSLKAKLVFHLVLTLLYHIVYLVMYDYIRKQQNNAGVILLNVLFMIKSFFLWISCLQIKSGYPTMGIYSSFFVKSYFWIFNVIYLIWRAIPFVFELKTLLDWTFIKTTLNFYEWLKLEDIYSTQYTRKCDLEYKKIYGRNFGQSQFVTTKIGSGFLLFVGICLVIFFPLLFYSTANPTFEYNAVSMVRLDISIVGFESFYQNQFFKLNPEAKLDLNDDLLQHLSKDKGHIDKSTRDAFKDYDAGLKLQSFSLGTWSEVYWSISTPSRGYLAEALLGNQTTMDLLFSYDVTRRGPAAATMVSQTQNYTLSTEMRYQLAQMIKYPEKYSDPSGVYDLNLTHAYNPYLLNKVPGLVSVNFGQDRGLPFLANCMLGVRLETYGSKGYNGLLYWNFNCSQSNIASDKGAYGRSGPFFFIQSGLIAGNTNVLTSTIGSIGIITFYTSFVLTVGRFVRMYASGLVGSIFYQDLDNVDLLLSYTMDIYMAREAGDLELEEIMMVHLLRIYRDTQLLQIWTNTNRSIL
jgi:hypothetical protein